MRIALSSSSVAVVATGSSAASTAGMYAADVAREQLDWAKQVYRENKGVTDEIVDQIAGFRLTRPGEEDEE